MKVQTLRNTFPWLCWISAALIYAFQYGIYAAPAGFSHDIKHGLGLTNMQLGFFTSAFLYSYVVMQIPAGILLDKFGSRKTLLFSMFVILAGLLLLITAENFTMGFTSRLLMGLGGGAAFVCAIYLGRSWLPVGLFPFVLGVTEAMSGLGEYSFMNISALLSHVMNWRMVFLCFLVLGILLYLLIFVYVKDRKYLKMKNNKHGKVSYKHILLDSRLWLLSLMTGCCFAHYMTLASFWQVPFLMDQDNISNVYAVFINGFTLIGFIVGCPVLGYLSKFVETKKLILVAAILELIFLVLANELPGRPHFQEVLLFLSGFFTANVLLAFSLIREFTPTNAYGFCSGFVNMFFGLIGMILLPVIGYLYDTTNKDVSLTILPIFFVVIFGILCYLLFLYIHKKKRTQQ